jgi:hypothetical protein
MDENGAWTRQGESFWRAHHEAWKRSDLNQRQYCDAEGIPLKAFRNWRAIFKAEPQPPERKLLYRRRGLSPPFSPHLSPLFSPGTYPSSSAGPIVPRPREGHRRRFSEALVSQYLVFDIQQNEVTNRQCRTIAPDREQATIKCQHGLRISIIRTALRIGQSAWSGSHGLAVLKPACLQPSHGIGNTCVAFIASTNQGETC